MKSIHPRRARVAHLIRFTRMVVMIGMIFAASKVPPEFAGGDGFRMASVGPGSRLCCVGGSGENPGQAACVRTVAAGFTPYGEPAAGVLFATLALAPASRRRKAVRFIS